MILQKLLKKVYSSRSLFAMGLIAALVAALFGGAFLPVNAALSPVITQVGVRNNSMVQLRIDNLPANTEFAVTMGKAGSGGYDHLIAHFTTAGAGSYTYWFEILTDVKNDPTADVRIDDHSGTSATLTFNTASTTTVVSTPVPTAVPSTTSTTTTGSGGAYVSTSTSVKAVHVVQGGLVLIQYSNLPVDIEFTITIGAAGTQGIGGTLIAHLNSGSTAGNVAISKFEIPTDLHNAASMDFRMEGGGYVYVVTFNNVTY
jgi:hypothetical protein